MAECNPADYQLLSICLAMAVRFRPGWKYACEQLIKRLTGATDTDVKDLFGMYASMSLPGGGYIYGLIETAQDCTLCGPFAVLDDCHREFMAADPFCGEDARFIVINLGMSNSSAPPMCQVLPRGAPNSCLVCKKRLTRPKSGRYFCSTKCRRQYPAPRSTSPLASITVFPPIRIANVVGNGGV